jgi:phosphoserine phosphatase RsbU/P
VTFWLGCLDLDDKTLSYSSAGHPAPLLYNSQTDSIQHLAQNGLPLGWLADPGYVQEEAQLASMDKLCLYTDGATEIFNDNKAFFGESRLETALRDTIHSQTDAILDGLVLQISDFSQGHPIQDDISLMLVELA